MEATICGRLLKVTKTPESADLKTTLEVRHAGHNHDTIKITNFLELLSMMEYNYVILLTVSEKIGAESPTK